ncbi:uncharacterized protein PFLUO_LOCUS6548 [Penicillium psychrofluorescens]|uniref:uncharacterized protein n=1 Tax=Penicillium psychrofluorescens TaxID=3158075 RepID=UPI003CCD932B
MLKRRREDPQPSVPPTKRARNAKTGSLDRLSSLSDELLLHILSFLPISSLNVCQSLSRRFNALSGDSELWKRQYYSQWVRPRARRLANSRRTTLAPSKTEYSPKVSTWFDHSHLAEDGRVTNWKRQYRLRHNWSKGACRVTEVEFAEPPCPPMLVKLCAGIVFTADSTYGLRAWTANDPKSCLARASFSDGQSKSSATAPTALAVSQQKDGIEIVVGFVNGCFSLYFWNPQTFHLDLRSSHIGSSGGAITAMASSSPYLLMVSQHKILSLYNLRPTPHAAGSATAAKEPQQLASLRADNIVAPMTLSLRVSPFDITATIVYSFFHIGCGWSLGIQELRLGKDGQQRDSQLATTVDSQYGIQPLQGLPQTRKRRHSTAQYESSASGAPSVPSIIHQQPPTSMSYSHPYLLTSHADNTLTMYLVVSTTNTLFVRGGQRLWGHTSSVSAVQVTNRGKAVSVSSRGDELRIWELEMAVASLNTRRPVEENSIQISAENKPPLPGPVLEANPVGLTAGATRMQGCVGFDEERVVLLREKGIGTPLLECYDFT